MAEDQAPKPQKTLDELSKELDNDPLLKEDDSSIIPVSRTSKSPQTEQISDADLQEAAEAADDTDEDEQQEESSTPGGSLRVESDPNAKRPRFYKRKKFWFSLIFLLILAFALAWFIRPARLFMVNLVGLRGSLDISTFTLPDQGQESSTLTKVKVALNGQEWETDDTGKLTAHLKYGNYDIVAKKAGYQDATHSVMLDFDPFFYLLGGRQHDQETHDIKLQLKAVGIPVKINVKDWLTDGPLVAGVFSVGAVVAKPNDQGVVLITIPATEEKAVKVKAVFGGRYLDKEFEVPLDGSESTVSFVPEGREYFISNRNGLAVYSSNLDGSSVSELVPASARETSAMNIAISPSGKYGMLASTRDGKRDAQGTLLQQLFIVDLSNKKLSAVDQGHWFNFVDWSGDTLVYTVGERKAGSATISQRLTATDATNAKRTDISDADGFSAARVAVGSVFYLVNGEASSPELRITPIKGGTERKLGAKVQQISQVDFDRFSFQLGDGTWQEYNVNTSQIKIGSAPSDPSRAMLASASQDGQNRLVIGRVDGKLALVIKNVANGQEKPVYSAAGIRGPLRLINDVVVFRMGEGAATADYVVSAKGGAPKKITDVTLSVSPVTPSPNYFSFY
jgi:hypothetical protein